MAAGADAPWVDKINRVDDAEARRGPSAEQDIHRPGELTAPLPTSAVLNVAESARLAALHEYRLLDAPADDELSAVVRAAAAVARVPHATLNLIDADRQCQLTTVGFGGADSARADSMCALHFEQGELVHVVDASLDPRFARNPWVDGRLGQVRFYASTPLISPAGHALGSLCVFDPMPGQLDQQQMDVLRDLATVLVALFERRRQTRAAEHQAHEAAEARELMAMVMAEAEERWELSEVIGETIDVGLVVVDPRGRLTSFNRTARRWHGLAPDASLDPNQHAGVYDLFAADGRTPLAGQDVPVHRVLREGAVDGVEIVIAPRGRPPRTVSCSGRLMRRADGTPLGAVVAMSDVTADRAQAQTLQAAHAELASTHAGLASAHAELAAHTGRVEALAEASRALASAQEPHEVICQAVRDLTGADAVYLLQPDEQGDLRSSAAVGLPVETLHVPAGEVSLPGLALAAGRSLFVADVPAHPAASARLVQTLGTASGLWQPVVLPGLSGALSGALSRALSGVSPGERVVGVLGVYWRTPREQLPAHVLPLLQTLTGEAAHAIERADLLARLAQAAERDPLTGLANRRRWDDAVGAEVQRAGRSGAPLTLAMIDLDHFKRYNDTHGHLAGDVLLREFAEAASSCLRGIDTLARWGGEEFVLALPGCTEHDARVVVDRIRAHVPRGQTCTIGVAQWRPGLTAARVMSQADAALYRGKEGGRNATIVHSALLMDRK